MGVHEISFLNIMSFHEMDPEIEKGPDFKKFEKPLV